MDNPFDQFDPAPRAPVQPQPVDQVAAPMGAPAAPAANPFDQFDPAPRPAPAGPSGNLGDVARAGSEGLVTGIPNTVLGIAEAQERGMNMGLPPGADIIGGMLQPAIAPLLDKLTGQTSRPILTPRSDMIRKGLTDNGVHPEQWFPEEHMDTMQERIARLGGEGIVSMIAPGGAAKGWERVLQLGKEMVAGGTGGAAAQFGMEVAPEEWKPAAGLAGGLVGGLAGYAPLAAAEAGVKSAGRTLRPVLANLRPKTAEAMAAEQLGEVVGKDRGAVLDTLNNRPENASGAPETSAQVTGNVQLGSLERALARGDETFKARLKEQREVQAAAQLQALDNIQQTGQPAEVAGYLNRRMRELEQQADDLFTVAQAKAQGAVNDLGEPTAREVGSTARAAINDQLKHLSAEASKLWKSIDPDGDTNLTTAPLIRETARIYGTMSPEQQMGLAPVEKQIAGLIGSYDETLPFDRFSALRSQISTAMREVKSPLQPNQQAYARLSQLRSAIEQAVEDTVAGKVEEQRAAVANGTLSPDDTLEANFLRQAKEWYAKREATGAGVAPGDAVPEGARPTAVPRDLGTAGEAQRGPAGLAGNQGLPENAGLPRATQGDLNGQIPDGGAGVRPVSGAPARAEGDARSEVGREPDGSLAGLPRKAGTHTASANPDAQQVAKGYMDKAGLPYKPPATYAKVNPKRAARIAAAYDAMKHDPQNPVVKRAYEAMAKETLDQYQAMLDDGMQIEFIPPGTPDPYAGNPRNMTEDVRANKHMWVFPTKDGFGSDATFDVSDNPLLGDSGFQISGQPATINDIFRAVHDYFGHVKEGVGFRADGEENAWRAHSAMYSPEARKAMSSETRGQNSWVNYGPYGETNRTARSEDTHYADQKIGILPDWAINEAAGDEVRSLRTDMAKRLEDAGRPAVEAEANAAITEAVYDAMGKRLGKSGKELADEYNLPSVTNEEPKGRSLAQKVIKLDDVREKKQLQAFHGNLMEKVAQRAKEIGAATKAARDKGIFKGFDVGARLRSQNSKGDPLPPMKIEGQLLREWRDTPLQRAPFERMGIEPTIVEFNGKQYVPVVRVLQGVEDQGDWSRFDTYTDLVGDRKMGGLKAVGPTTLYQSSARGPYNVFAAYMERPHSSMLHDILEKALKQADGDYDQIGLIIDNDRQLYQGAKEVLKRHNWSDESIDRIGGVSTALYQIIKDNAMSREEWDAGRAAGLPAVPGSVPTFYSAAERAVAASKNNKANADQWLATLKNTPGVKPEELEWLGLNEWLRSQGGPVTKEALQDYIKANSIEIEETRLIGNGLDPDGEGLDIRVSNFEPNEPDSSWIQENANERVSEIIDDIRDEIIDNYARSLGVPESEIRALFDPEQLHPDLFDGETPMRTLTQEQIELRDEIENEAKDTAEEKAIEIEEASYYEDPDASASARVRLPNGEYRKYYIDRHSYGGGSIMRDDGTEVESWNGNFDDADIEAAIRNDLREEFGEDGLGSDVEGADGPTKYGGYALKGGEDYTELLLRLPKGGPTEAFTASHWDQPNVVAHVRFDTRTLGGKKSLFIQEIQSDWHQNARDRGYRTNDSTEKYQAAHDAWKKANDEWMAAEHEWGVKNLGEGAMGSDTTTMALAKMRNKAQEDYYLFTHDRTPEKEIAYKRSEERYEALNSHFKDFQKTNPLRKVRDDAHELMLNSDPSRQLPDAPFKTSWPELVLKRMIRHAAENGFDQIVWTPGDLKNGSLITRPIEKIRYYKREDGDYSVDTDVGSINQVMSASELANAYGGKLAERIVAGEGKLDDASAPNSVRTLQLEEPIRVGGDLQTFYGKIVPNMMSKVVKNTPALPKRATDYKDFVGNWVHKFDTQLRRVPMKIDGDTIQAVAVTITDKMRDSVLNVGQPLFQKGKRGAIQFGTDKSSLISLLKSADASTAPHELAHHFLAMYQDIAVGDKAPNAIREDWRIVKNWWGKNAVHVAADAEHADVTPAMVHKLLKDGTTGKADLDTAIQKGMHEQWARAFEAYLRTGDAPTVGLKRVFEQFKQWLGNIYRSLTDLKVDLSPDIKGVFDRMLGALDEAEAAPKPPGPKLMNAEQVGRFKAATAATRNIKDTYSSKPAAPVPQMLRRPGTTYPYDMSDEATAGALWRPGPAGKVAIDNVLKAAGKAPKAKEAVEGAAILSLHKSALKDGVVDPTKFEAWRTKHAEALSAVPELDKRLQSAAKATKAMEDISEARKTAMDTVQKSAIGKLLKLNSDADVSATVGGMLGTKTAVKDMRELAGTARKDPDAIAGLRRAVVDYMLGRFKTSKDAVSAAAFIKYLGKVAPALREVLSPEQMNNLRALAHELNRATRDVRAPGGGSDTAENLMGIKKHVHDEKPSLLRRLFIDSGAAAGFAGAAHLVTGGASLPLTVGSAIASALGSEALQSARAAGLRKVDELVQEAVLNPDVMKALLAKAPNKANAGSHKRLAVTLSKIGAFAAMAGAE